MTATPTTELAGLRSSTAALLLGLEAEQWSDDARAPTLLPGWTRGHVLTHVARNADGVARTLAGALRGEAVARYPDGRTGRDADIEAGAGRPLAELVADVRESAERLDRVFGAVADTGGWELPTEKQHPASDWLFARLNEVEIHRVDLDGAYTAAEWPPPFVVDRLPELADGVAKRASVPVRIEVTGDASVSTDLVGRTWRAGDGTPVEVAGPDWAVLAWLLGRSAAAAGSLTAMPELRPWR